MYRLSLVLLMLVVAGCNTRAQTSMTDKTTNKTKKEIKKVIKSDAEWQKELTPQEFYVLRMKGTDRRSNGGYTKHFEEGTYICRGCKTELFESDSKFESYSGWPSFDDAIEGSVITHSDTSHGMVRTEIVCATCDGHLGHVFNDGPRDTTGKRYCVNTSSIEFVKEGE